MKQNEDYINEATEKRPDINARNVKNLVPLEIVLLAMDLLKNDLLKTKTKTNGNRNIRHRDS